MLQTRLHCSVALLGNSQPTSKRGFETPCVCARPSRLAFRQRVCRAMLAFVFLLASASAEKGYNRNRTRSPGGDVSVDRGPPTARIVGGERPLLPTAMRVYGPGMGSMPSPHCSRTIHSRSHTHSPPIMHWRRGDASRLNPCACAAGAEVTPFEHNWVILFRTGGHVLVNARSERSSSLVSLPRPSPNRGSLWWTGVVPR